MSSVPQLHFTDPGAVEEVEKYAWMRNEACTCDMCDPMPYIRSLPAGRQQEIHLPLTYNRYDRLVNGVPQLTPSAYGAMHLVRRTIEYSRRGDRKENLNDAQLIAIDKIRALQETEGRFSLWERLNDLDGRTVSDNEMVELAGLFSDIIFFGAMQGIKFRWVHPLEHAFAECDLKESKPVIRMDFRDWREEDWTPHSDVRRLHRLSTLLHELLRGFLELHVRKGCVSYDRDVNPYGGNGRAFQRIALAIEEVCPRFLDFQANLFRFGSLSVHQDEANWTDPPSICDLMHYKFPYVTRFSGDAEDGEAGVKK